MWRLGHRPELDALRGVAVLLVIAAHLRVPGLPAGGSSGVTLFFVLSGFLITCLLVEEYEREGRVNLLAFYRRRALRLLPALGVVIVVWTVWDAFFEPQYHPLRNLLLTVGYVSNIARAGGTSVGSLGHTWSLAIEEQFYVVWPLLLVLLGLRRRRTMLVLVSVAAVILAAHRLSLFRSGAFLYRIEFGTDTRGDALLLGCALGLLVTHLRLRVPAWLAAGGVVALLLATASDHRTAPFRWSLTASAVGSVLLVGWLVTRAPVRVRTMPQWLVWTGQRSYGLYLWHIPIYWAVFAHLDGLPLVLRDLLIIALTLPCVVLSYEFVEKPFLRRRHAARPAPTALQPSTA